MSNLPPNPYSNVVGVPPPNDNTRQVFNHSQPVNQVPLNQLPPGYGGMKDNNSNSPLHGTVSPQNNAMHNANNYNQSANSSPAFNQPGILPQGLQPSSRPPMPPSSKPLPLNPTSNQYSQNYPLQRQINDNAPPLNSSSQYNQPVLNGPHSIQPGLMANLHPVSSSAYNSVPMANRPFVSSAYGSGPISTQFGPPPVSKPTGQTPMTSQPNMPFSGPARNSPLLTGPPVSGPPMSNAPVGPPLIRPPGIPVSTSLGIAPPLGQPINKPMGINGPNLTSSMLPPMSAPPLSVGAPAMLPSVSGPLTSSYPGLYNGPNQPIGQTGLPIGQNTFSGQPPPMPPMAQNISLPQGSASGPLPAGPLGPKTNMQNRYPQMPPSNYNHQQPTALPAGKQYPQQHNTQGLTQQMGQLSVTKQGFDQLWGRHMFDLLQCKHILPEYPEEPPEVRLAHQFAESPNCSTEIFRCTLNRIPETNNLLQKSRLPLGILIHPFKDLNHLPVIQCTSIVRCRACRTYINPFVYFVDSKRWKCNLCYRVNDLPEEFQYDPVSKSYGDPSRRPEIKSATIEFIAPGEYMLRPPQPAVYLFLFDVSQLARDSGYLQVACDTLKNNLDQLPGDARTQIGFICYDSHVHYYLMSEGLTRPKEMTVLDIDEIFLPSPESLLVNLGERRELVRELLTVLPQRYSAPATPASALGAALQAAYKLMSPTGGRITVFQTCLPNVGPGALQPREDPNARSSKDVAHLNPATDFYKRIALDCSGAQIAVDLFLLNSQYSDLATLSGMSKFSAGTLYHIPLFRAARAHQAETLTRMFTRYLTRKIGFEAVMRVRCTRGISIHTFHGNFFVRSTDLLSLPNVSPDAGFGMQLTIEESLSDLQQVCFQAALLYTSSKGERRIRVHTLALPIANSLSDVLHFADQQCVIGLVSKMAADRCLTASLTEAREAVSNVCVDALSAYRLAQNLPAGANSASLHAPASLRLLPLYLLALLKRKAFRTGTSTRLDDRVADMCALKCLPLAQLTRLVYPDLYAVHALREHVRDCHRHAVPGEDDEEPAPDPPRLQLSAERVNATGAYLLDDGECMIVYVCNAVSPAFLSDTFGVAAYTQLQDEAHSLPKFDSDGNALLHAFIDKLNDDRPYPSDILVLRDNSPSRALFTDRLVDDRVESAFSYYEFLQHVKTQVK